jgi:histone-lysine N-methyltransferase SUV39H
VRSSVGITKGQYIDRYVGEITTLREAQRRRDASNLAERKDVYLFALDKFRDPESFDLNERDRKDEPHAIYLMDHSCELNAGDLQHKATTNTISSRSSNLGK